MSGESWRSECRVYHGGLMRCCLATLSDFIELEATQPPQEGGTLQCKYCSEGTMIFRDGAWRWNRPEKDP